MKTIICILLFSISTPFMLQAQMGSDSLTTEQFKKFLKKEYYFLANPGENEVLSNYASLDVEDGSVEFAGTFFFDKSNPAAFYHNWILSINAKGSGSEGSFPLYSGNEFTSNVGIEAQLKFPFFGKKSFLEYSSDAKTALNLKIQELEKEFQIGKIRINNRADSLLLIKALYETQAKQIEDSLKVEKKHAKVDEIREVLENLDMGTKLGRSMADSLELEIKKAKLEINKIEVELKEGLLKIKQINYQLKHFPDSDDQFYLFEKNKIAEKRKVEQSLKIKGHKVEWVSINYELENTRFKHFTPSNDFESQIEKEGFLSHTFRIQYSRSIIKVADYSYYFTFGGAYSIEDNYSDLTSIKIVERTNYGLNPDDRYSVKETKVLTNDYRTDLSVFKIFSDYYLLLFKDNRAAARVRLEAQTKDETKDQLNLGLGFIFSFTDKEDKTSRINTELYYELGDLTNENNSEEKLMERSTIGLRFTVPFIFKN